MKWAALLLACLLKCIEGLSSYEATRPCKETLPLHATLLNYTSQSCTWQCHEGYYLTRGFQSTPTCRKCARPTQKCSVGSFVDNCTDTSNFACKSCPTLTYPKEYYVQEDCSQIRCKRGFYLKSSKCELCPSNNYCPLGLSENVCPQNCSSNQGSTSLLDCKAPITTDISVYSLNYLTFVPSNSLHLIHVPKTCYDIDNILYVNLEYGILFKCVFENTPLSIIFHTICYVGFQECSNGVEFEAYLQAKAISLQKSIETGILKCMARNFINEIEVKTPYILIDRVISSQQLINETFENKNAIYLERPTNSPDVSDGHLDWFENKELFMDGFRFFYVVIFILLLCILLLCTVCYIQISREKNIRSIYKKMEKNHKVLNNSKV